MVGGKIEIASMDYCFEKFDYNKEKRDSALVSGELHSREFFALFCFLIICLFLRGRNLKLSLFKN